MTAREVLIVAAINGMYSKDTITKVDCDLIECAKCPIGSRYCVLEGDYFSQLKELPITFFESIATTELAITNYLEFTV